MNSRKLRLGDVAVLDQLVGLLEHLGGVDHVEVRDVGAEQRLELQAHLLVERDRRHGVVGLAPEVEVLGEQAADVVGAVDVHAREVVAVEIALGELFLRRVGLERVEVPGDDVVDLALVARVARGVLLEQSPELGGVEVRRLEVLVHERPVALLPVAEQVAVEVARPPDAAFEEPEVERREPLGHAAEEEAARERVVALRRSARGGCPRSSTTGCGRASPSNRCGW